MTALVPTVAVQVRKISKSFGNIRVLSDVSMEVRAGEIYALVGANGAGKSTLIKIICGYYSDYQGEFFIGTQPCRFASPNEAYSRGVVAVHQLINQGVIPTLTVAENLVLGEMLSGSNGDFRYRRDKVRERAQVIAARMALQHLDLDTPVSSLVQSERQLIAIARALSTNPKLLILDEPTSSLSERETEKLFVHLQRLRAEGVAILYVSHRLHEIERLADRVGVMRDGSFRTCLVRPFQVSSIVQAMMGDSFKVHERKPHTAQTAQGLPRLELRELVVQEGSSAINMTAYANDIIGITGLIGAGKSELAAVLFGLAEPVSGQILVDGVVVHSKTPAQAIANGIFLVPEDRASKAVVPEFSIRCNMTLPFMAFFSSSLGLIRHGQEQAAAQHMVAQLGIKCEGDATLISSLSGGNQQKVVVSRWLLKPSKVLLLDEPYQGVDISTRLDINTYLRTQCQDRAVIVFAADLDEVLEVADRVVVINHGSLVGEQHHTDIRRAELVGWSAQGAASAKPNPLTKVPDKDRPMSSKKDWSKIYVRWGFIVVMCATFIGVGVFQSAFVTWDNQFSILLGVAVVAILALGVTFTLVIDGLDLSVGSTAAMTVMMSSYCMVVLEWSGPVTIVACLLIGALIGLVNGLLIVHVGIPDLLATLGTMFLIMGLQLIPSGGRSIGTGMLLPDGTEAAGAFSQGFLFLGQGRLFGMIPMPVLFMLALAVLIYGVLEHTRWGRIFYAIGGNPEASRLVGANVDLYRVMAYVLSGLIAAFGGVVLAARIGRGDVSSGGSLLLDAVGAALIGFAVLGARRPNAFGTVVGATFIGLLLNGLTMFNLPYFWQDFIKGLVLVAALAFTFGLARRA